MRRVLCSLGGTEKDGEWREKWRHSNVRSRKCQNVLEEGKAGGILQGHEFLTLSHINVDTACLLAEMAQRGKDYFGSRFQSIQSLMVDKEEGRTMVTWSREKRKDWGTLAHTSCLQLGLLSPHFHRLWSQPQQLDQELPQKKAESLERDEKRLGNRKAPQNGK